MHVVMLSFMRALIVNDYLTIDAPAAIGQWASKAACKVRRSTSAVLVVTWVRWLCRCPMVSCYSSASMRTLETRRRLTLIPSVDCRSWVTLDLPEMRTAAACPYPTVIYLLIRCCTCVMISRIICLICQSCNALSNKVTSNNVWMTSLRHVIKMLLRCHCYLFGI